MKRQLQWLLDQLFPAKCAVCGGTAPAGICPECLDKLPRTPEKVCPHCGRGRDKCFCSHMRGECFHRLAAPCYYTAGMRTGICALKFQGVKVHAGWIGELMAETVKRQFLDQGETIDLMVPAPLSEKRLRERGFNQSLLLARRMAQLLPPSILLDDTILVKGRDTASQHDLDYEQRRENLNGVFRADKRAVGKTVLLVDDVATTGTTLSECGRALYLAGAERVLCCTAAVAASVKGEDRL